MINQRICNIWSIMIVISMIMVTGYQLVFQSFPYYRSFMVTVVLSIGLTQFLFRKMPRFGPPFLFINIILINLFCFSLVSSIPMMVIILFFIPIYSLFFTKRIYFVAGVISSGIGHALFMSEHSVNYHVIFFILLLCYSCLLAFVSELIAKHATTVARFREQVAVLTMTIEARDSYTQGHSRRVSLYAVEIGRLVPGIDLHLLKVAGDLHDIGKISTPDSVLLKPGRLTNEEYDIIKRHPVDGANMLMQFDIDGPILEGVLYHHERLNGSGYPEGLKGDDIPLFARILAIADSFDAMTTTRSYRAAFPTQRAYDEIVSLSGKFYDPFLVSCFQKVYPEILAIFDREEKMCQTIPPTAKTESESESLNTSSAV